jgi:hypothetical protein
MRRVWIGGIGLLVLALALPMCTGVPLTAPANSFMQLIANPEFVSPNGGVSVITAIVTEPAGTPPPNGTVVFFFTNLGRVDAEGKTKDGIARVNFVSDSRSGIALVTALSGGTATPTATPTPPQGLIPSIFDMAVAHAASTPGKNTASIEITVGSGAGAKVVVVVSPARISSPGSALITANVFDKDGNPVANVPVIFGLEMLDAALYETLDSGGAPQFTDTNGQAFDRVRTRAPIGVPHSVKITATIPTVATPGTVTLVVN